jgi:hypothetical protein
MSDQERAIVRSCLEQVTLGMTEAREVRAWWETLGRDRQREWKEFAASVSMYWTAIKR